MDATTTPTTTVGTCAKPGCGTQTTLAESTYIDGYGQVCSSCAGPVPDWFGQIEPPF